MKLISYESGRVIQLWMQEEVRPLKYMYAPEAVLNMRQHFQFSRVFTDGDLPEGGKVPNGSTFFRDGRLILDGRQIIISELSVHTDGVVLSSATSEDAEFVLEYALKWTQEELGMRQMTTPKLRSRHSNVIVEFDKPVDAAIEAFQKIGLVLSKAWSDVYGATELFEISRLGFNSDPETKKIKIDHEFVIERRKGAPYAANRFFCAASLPTQRHLSVLTEIEGIIAAS